VYARSRATARIAATVLAIAAASQLAVPARAEGSLTPHKATYDVKISVLGGTLVSEVTEAEPGYMANSVIKPTGMSRMLARGIIQESSFFVPDRDGVLPAQYRSIDTLSSDDRVVSLDFDWRAQKVEGVVNDERFESELNSRVHDRVSIQYELMHDLQNGGAEERYWMLDGAELKLLNVRKVGHRTVDVPYGKFEVVGIQHSKENSNRVTTLWCAEALGYLPVIIEQHRKGKLGVRAVLRTYEPVAAHD
jgi:hypothetical protein